MFVYGYDGYTSCSRPYRMSKAFPEPPCDFRLQSWCTIPGSAYPWRAVRRFVHENQGLMRRMYGDQRHISVLRAEIESNDVEYTSEWKFQEDVRRRYTASTSEPTTSSKDHITSPYFRPASTTASMPKVTNALKSQQIKSDYTQYPKLITPNPENNDSVTSKAFESTPNTTLVVDKTTAPVSTTVQTTSEQTTVNLSTSSSILSSEKTLNTAADTTQSHDPSTTPCTSTEQTEASTVEPPTATTVEFASEENTTATTHTQKVFESELFQDSQQQQQADSSSESTPSAAVKLRGVNACPVKEEVVAPFWANNTRGEVLALLNLYPFEQYVHWEKCTFEYKQMFCREGCRCEQQYRLHRLLAYDPNNECRGIFSDWFKFPSCCVCRCYDLPIEFQITSRSPRTQSSVWNLYSSSSPDQYRVANAG
ncbi:protein spaetzle 4 isoform X2 [Zootermopsis nevadensis]|nr:protein spaetzle 4 isoform X2 [Zootermopsis nevadensis]XP_021920631.1 protein spaetzle 4 isoform X2 [Zootermopsis nevadensis]XP_021920640.1 protein spaetzle 4 isoform X2 [Zootermopsis nevadensis]